MSWSSKEVFFVLRVGLGFLRLGALFEIALCGWLYTGRIIQALAISCGGIPGGNLETNVGPSRSVRHPGLGYACARSSGHNNLKL